ncbi:MAG: hypothetical protein IJQ99_08990 [Synergistaceae bacterium]|nr:hypothetical protein [Synergistaceae bacterium]
MLLCYLYFRGIGDHGLIDPVEGINASIALHMSAGENYFIPKIGDSLASGCTMGAWWLSALGLNIFGWSEFAVRFFSALSGLGMILAAALSAGEGRKSWLASCICASMILCFTVSQISSSHAIFSCLTAFAMFGIVKSRTNRDWLFLSHFLISLAFIAHGASGIFLPFLSVIIYSVLCEDWDLLKDFFTWPFGIAMTLLISGLYFVVIITANYHLVYFMFVQNYSYSFGGIIGSIIFILMCLTPFHGFIIKSVFEIFPKEYPAEKSPELFMLVWALVFGASEIFSGDLLAISTSVPALSAIVAIKLDYWLDKKISSVRYSFLINILILFPVLYIFMPLTARYFPVIKVSLMSFIPYLIVMSLFLLASWYYTKTRQIKKWVRNVSAAALLCLMPLGGIFDLTAENYSVREIGMSLREAIKGNQTVIQYRVNYPSMYFYTLRNSILIDSPLNHGIEEKKFVADTSFIDSLWKRKDRTFLVMPEVVDVNSILPKKTNVYNITRAEGMLLLSNQ